jgi:hypothetical protein
MNAFARCGRAARRQPSISPLDVFQFSFKKALFAALTLPGLGVFLAAAGPGENRSHQARGEVLDAETQKPLPCRVYIQGGDGSWYFPRTESSSGSAVEYRMQKSWNPACVEMHTTLSAHPFVAELPAGTYTVLVERGKEYFPESYPLKVDQDDVRFTIRLRRWINMEEKGWFSGDTHVHRPLGDLPNLLLAEDLNVAFPLVSWVYDAFVPPAKGRPNPDQDTPAQTISVDRTHVIYPRNTEYEITRVGQKSHTLGAFFVLGHKTLFEEGVPPVRPILRRAREEGALIELDKHNWPWSMMLVPILGADLYELANNHLWRTDFGYRDFGVPAADYMGVERDEKGWTERGWIDYGFKNYYALLDSGFRLRPTAGTASGVHTVPLGFGRVYVHLEQGFSYDAWARGLNEGRSFVTTGPMLLAQVNGKDPGSVFKPAGAMPGTYRVTGLARGAVPLQPVEIVVNGEVARTLTAGHRETPGKGYERVIDEELTLDQSSWIAVRCFEDRADKRARFAHTAPFYIEVPGKPLRPRRAEIDFLVRRIESELARNAEVLPPPALEEYREALRVYQEIAQSAR